MLLVLLISLMLSGSVFAEAIGNYRIPNRVDFAGKTIEPGTYALEIIDGPEGPYIQLSKGGEVVQKDLAIVIPAQGTVKKPQVQIAKIAGQNFVRIRVRQGENYYYAYMELVR